MTPTPGDDTPAAEATAAEAAGANAGNTVTTLPADPTQPTDPAQPAPGDRWSRWFLLAIGVGLFLGNPLALLPRAVNPDAPGPRLVGMVLCLIVGVAAAFASSRRSQRVLYLLGGGVGAAVVAFLPGGLSGYVFGLPLPVRLLLLAPAALVLAAVPWRPPTRLLVAICVVAAAALANAALYPGWRASALTALAGVVLPLAIAVAARQRRLGPGPIAAWASALWLVLLVYILQDPIDRGILPSLTGNQNWTAAALLVLAPWPAWWLAQRLLVGRAGRAPATRTRPVQRIAVLLAVLLIAVPTLAIIHIGQVRAGFLTVAALLAWALLWRIRPVGLRVGLVVLAIGLVLVGGYSQRQRLARFSRADIRLPLWQASLYQAADKPLLGGGPGRLEVTMARHVARTDLFRRPFRTEVIEHTHNQFLQVLATLGLPALLAWTVLLLPALGDPWRPGDPVGGLARLSLQAGLAMAMFDKAWDMMPSALLVLIALGLVWREQLRDPAPGAVPWLHPAAAYSRLARLGVAAVALVAIGLSLQSLAADWYRRRARQYSDVPDSPAAARAALDAYRQADRILPGTADLPYSIATRLIQDFGDPQAGLDVLVHSLWPVAPDYAHSHRIAARALLDLGDLDTARIQMQLDADLFPGSPEASQRLYFLACLGPDSPAARAERARLDALARRDYLVRIWSRPGPSMRRRAGALDRLLSENLQSFITDVPYLPSLNSMGTVDPDFPHVAATHPDLIDSPDFPYRLPPTEPHSADRIYWQALRWRDGFRQLVATRHAADPARPLAEVLAATFHDTVNGTFNTRTAWWPESEGHVPPPAHPLHVIVNDQKILPDRAYTFAWLAAHTGAPAFLATRISSTGDYAGDEVDVFFCPDGTWWLFKQQITAGGSIVPGDLQAAGVVTPVPDLAAALDAYRGTGDYLGLHLPGNPPPAATSQPGPFMRDVGAYPYRIAVVTPPDAYLVRHQLLDALLANPADYSADTPLAPLRWADPQPRLLLDAVNAALPPDLPPIPVDRLVVSQMYYGSNPPSQQANALPPTPSPVEPPPRPPVQVVPPSLPPATDPLSIPPLVPDP